MQAISRAFAAIWPYLIRFARMAFFLLAGVWIGLGLLSATTGSNSKYDPATFAVGISALFAFVCTFAAFLIYRNRVWRRRALRWKARNEELSDRIGGEIPA